MTQSYEIQKAEKLITTCYDYIEILEKIVATTDNKTRLKNIQHQISELIESCFKLQLTIFESKKYLQTVIQERSS